MNRPGVRSAATVLLLFFTLALFFPSVFFDYIVYDDQVYVANNPRVLGGLGPEAVKWAFTAAPTGEWQPVTWLTFMAGVDLFGPGPMGQHLINVLLHVANTALVLLFFVRTTRRFWPSLVVAALFALHPLRVESVAWVAERKDVLYVFFWAMAMVAYQRYTQTPGTARFLAVAGLFALGLMSKPMLVTFPCLLLLVDYWPLGRIRWERSPGPDSVGVGPLRMESWRVLWEKLPLLALSAASTLITVGVALKRDWLSLDDLSMVWRAANAVVSYATYIRQMVWPSGLTLFYPLPGDELAIWTVILCLALLALISFGALTQAVRRPYFFTGWFWFLGTLAPVISLTQQATADRFTYMPMVGLYAALVWGAGELFTHHRVPLRTVALLTVAVLAALAAKTSWQLRLWTDSVTLFSHSVRVTRDNYPSTIGLMMAYKITGQGEKALEQYAEAARIRPGWLNARHNKNADDYMRRKAYGAAVNELFMALRLRPGEKHTLNRLGGVRVLMGQYDRAETRFREALAADPDFEAARRNLEVLTGIRQARERDQGGFTFTLHY